MTEPCCKVGRVRDDYSMYNFDERLLHRYHSEDEGVRQLETWFNQLVLERAMEQAGVTVLDGEEANYHRLLTDDDVMDSTRNEAKRELRNTGVDVEQVKQDWVSYRTIHKHLKECLGVDTSRDDTPSISKSRNRLAKVKSRIKAVMQATLGHLAKHDEIEIEDPRVSIRATVRCGSCNRRHDVDEFLGEGGTCPCREGAATADEAGREAAQPTIRD